MRPPAMTEDQARQMAAALKLPYFDSELHMPTYAEGQAGRWRLVRGGFSIDHGYFGGPCATFGSPLLLRDRDGDGATWDTWMSLSPHEIESQALACHHANGHTAVMGLGMGWVAVNIALNPAVARVSVIERDPEVIDLFSRSGALDGLPAAAAGKLRIVQADALAWQPDAPVDFLYADIWRTLEEPQTLDDVRRMQANVAARRVYFWGQELFIHALALQAGTGAGQWDEAVRRAIMDGIGLPLLSADVPAYAALVEKAGTQRRARWPLGVPDVAR